MKKAKKKKRWARTLVRKLKRENEQILDDAVGKPSPSRVASRGSSRGTSGSTSSRDED